MKAALLFFFSVGWLFAQLSPATMNFGVRFDDEPPYFQSTTVSGGTPSVGSCSNVTGSLCGSILTQVTGQTVYVYWNNFGGLFGSGSATSTTSYQSTIPITASGSCVSGCRLTINVTIYPKTDPVFQATNNFALHNCTASGSPYTDLDACPVLTGPGSSTYTPLTRAGQQERDPEFGTLITRVTPAGTQRSPCGDAISMSFSSDGTLICTQSIGGSDSGTKYMDYVNGGGDAYTIPGTMNGTSGPMFDPLLPQFYYFPNTSNTVMQATWTNSFSTPTTVCTCPRGTCPNAGGFTNSSDGYVNKDGWIALVNNANNILMLCNVHTRAAYFYTFYPGIPTLTANGSIRDSVKVSMAFDVSNQLHIKLDGQTVGGSGDAEYFTYTKGASAIVDVGPQPLMPDSPYDVGGTRGPLKIQPTSTSDCSAQFLNPCHNAEHECLFSAPVNGAMHNFQFVLRGPDYPSYYVPAAQDLTNGIATSDVAHEAGGGRYLMHYSSHQTEGAHFSCATLAPVAVMDTDAATPITTYTITGVKTGSTTTLTVGGGTSGLANGNVLKMNAVAGVTGLNAINTACTVASLTATTLVCNGLATRGSWTGASVAAPATFTVNTLPGSDNHQAETVLFDFTDIGATPSRVVTRRLYKHGSWAYSDTYSGGYYWQPHSAIYHGGSIVCTGGNRGVPDNYYVVCYPTGYRTSTSAAAAGAGSVGAMR
jgi:hypothetical protein